MKTRTDDKKAVPKHKHPGKQAGEAIPTTYKRPLKGRRIFLDLSRYRGSATFEENLKLLGATIEKCFSKEVQWLITNQGTAKDYGKEKGGASGGPSTSAGSPASPSPFNVAAIKGAMDSPQAHSPGVADSRNVAMTRAKAMVQKATTSTATKKFGSMNIIDNAKRWHVKTIHIERAKKYVDAEIQKLPQSVRQSASNKDTSRKGPKHKVKRLKGSYIKLEAVSRGYRPVSKILDAFPTVNLNAPRGSCPFDKTTAKGDPKARLLARERDFERAEREEGEQNEQEGVNEGLKELEGDTANTADGGDTGNGRSKPTTGESAAGKNPAEAQRKHKGQSVKKKAELTSETYMGNRLFTAGELRNIMREKILAEQKRGYCELCEIKYENIDKHVRTEQHKNFVRNADNYHRLDTMIKQGPNMDQFLQDVVKYHHIHLQEALTESDPEDGINFLPEASSPSHRSTRRTPKHPRGPDRMANVTPDHAIMVHKGAVTKQVTNTDLPSPKGKTVSQSAKVCSPKSKVSSSKPLTPKSKVSSPKGKVLSPKGKASSHSGKGKKRKLQDYMETGAELKEDTKDKEEMVEAKKQMDVVSSPRQRRVLLESPRRSPRVARSFTAPPHRAPSQQTLDNTDCVLNDKMGLQEHPQRKKLHNRSPVKSLRFADTNKPETEMGEAGGSEEAVIVPVSPGSPPVLSETPKKSCSGIPGQAEDRANHHEKISKCPKTSEHKTLDMSNETKENVHNVAVEKLPRSPRRCAKERSPQKSNVLVTPKKGCAVTNSGASRCSPRKLAPQTLHVAHSDNVLEETVVSAMCEKRNFVQLACRRLQDHMTAPDSADDVSERSTERRTPRNSAYVAKLNLEMQLNCKPGEQKCNEASEEHWEDYCGTSKKRRGRHKKKQKRTSATSETHKAPYQPNELPQGLPRPFIYGAKVEDGEPQEHASPVKDSEQVALSPKVHMSEGCFSPWQRHRTSPRLLRKGQPQVLVSPIGRKFDQYPFKEMIGAVKQPSMPPDTGADGNKMIASPVKKVQFDDDKVSVGGNVGLNADKNETRNCEVTYRGTGNDLPNSTKATTVETTVYIEPPLPVRKARSTTQIVMAKPGSPEWRAKTSQRSNSHGSRQADGSKCKGTIALNEQEHSPACDQVNHGENDQLLQTPQRIPATPVKDQGYKSDGSEVLSPRSRKLKLKEKWLVASERSMSQLFNSEADHLHEFEGFENSERELPTDITYEVVSEIEVQDDSDQEWLVDEIEHKHGEAAPRTPQKRKPLSPHKVTQNDNIPLRRSPRKKILERIETSDENERLENCSIVPASENSEEYLHFSPIKLPPIERLLRSPVKGLFGVVACRAMDGYHSDMSPVKIPVIEKLVHQESSPLKQSEGSAAWDDNVDSYFQLCIERSAHKSVPGSSLNKGNSKCDAKETEHEGDLSLKMQASCSRLHENVNPFAILDMLPGNVPDLWAGSPRRQRKIQSPESKQADLVKSQAKQISRKQGDELRSPTKKKKVPTATLR